MGGEPDYALGIEAELSEITHAGLLKKDRLDQASG